MKEEAVVEESFAKAQCFFLLFLKAQCCKICP